MAVERSTTFVGTFRDDGSVVKALDVHRLVFGQLGLQHDEVVALQLEPGIKKFFVKLRSQEKVEEITADSECDVTLRSGQVTRVRLEDARGCGVRTLRVFRLPVEVNVNKVADRLAEFGEIVAAMDEKWTNYEGKGVLNGVRNIKIKLKKNIPSYLDIEGAQALILYDGQPKTCRKCHEEGHLFHDCPKRTVNTNNGRGGRRWETASGVSAAGSGGATQPAPPIQPAPPVQQPVPDAQLQLAAAAATAATITDADAELQPSGPDDGSSTDAEPDPTNPSPKRKRRRKRGEKSGKGGPDQEKKQPSGEPQLTQGQQDVFEAFCIVYEDYRGFAPDINEQNGIKSNIIKHGHTVATLTQALHRMYTPGKGVLEPTT